MTEKPEGNLRKDEPDHFLHKVGFTQSGKKDNS
jgi:hypothetical protein